MNDDSTPELPMDLSEFGTQPADARANQDQRNIYRPPGYYEGEGGSRPVQWKIVQSGVYDAFAIIPIAGICAMYTYFVHKVFTFRKP